MKFTKDTREYLEEGDILRFNKDYSEVVENIWFGANGRSMYVTARCIQDDNPVGRNWSMVGHAAYGQPASQLYGAEIVKPEDFTEGDLNNLDSTQHRSSVKSSIKCSDTTPEDSDYGRVEPMKSSIKANSYRYNELQVWFKGNDIYDNWIYFKVYTDDIDDAIDKFFNAMKAIGVDLADMQPVQFNLWDMDDNHIDSRIVK